MIKIAFLTLFLASNMFLSASLSVHIFCDANGKGLEKDRTILFNALRELNCTVNCFSAGFVEEVPHADVNIFVQHINQTKLTSATVNWFIPNPEWYLDDFSLLNSIDLILCRTKEVERIFTSLNKATYFLSFTSEDRFRQDVYKNSSMYLHVAGSSCQKGTDPIKKLWLARSDFPYLTLLKRHARTLKLKNLKVMNKYVAEEDLLKLQNESMVHLCLSETEGFGHYLMEAMSTGAVVVTTDAPPMNEFVTDPRCLVSFKNTSFQNLGTNYYVDQKALEKKIEALKKLSKLELKQIGENNRKRYLQITENFKENLKNLVQRYAGDL